jgi:hypothetical protein
MESKTFPERLRGAVGSLASRVGRGEAAHEAEAYRRLARLGEALVVLAATFAFCGWFVAKQLTPDKAPWAGWWLALFFLVFAAAFTLAALCNYYAQDLEGREQQQEKTAKYQVTELRIATLKEKGVPQDVRRCLRELMKPPPAGLGGVPCGKSEFLGNIRERLGYERTEEYADLILRYSKTWNAAAGDGAARAPAVAAGREQTASPTANNGGGA